MAHYVITYDVYFPDLNLRAFIHVESHFKGGRRYLPHLRIDRGVLASPLGEIILEDDSGSLDLIRIVLRFHRKADLTLLESVEDFRHGDRLDALVLDRPHNSALHQDEPHDRAHFAWLGFQCNVIE